MPTINWKKITVFTACCLPLLVMLYQFINQQLSAEPVDDMLRTTGIWALRLLLLTLAITPIRCWFGVNLVRYRRMLGLFVMFYVTLHLLIYLTFEFAFDIAAIVDDVLKRKFIFVGMLAFLLLIPLTITSTKGMMKRLGKRWVKLHKSVYLIAMLAVLHFVWLVKSDYGEPGIYAVLLTLLLLARRFSRPSSR